MTLSIRTGHVVIGLAACLVVIACGSGNDPAASDTSSGSGGASSSSSGSSSSGSCALAQSTTSTAITSPSGCHVRERDASACEAGRKAQGLDGFWLRFSCRVSLTVAAGLVSATADGQPDYLSNYFPKANACHEDYSGAIQNPNTIAAETYVVQFPEAPSTAGQPMKTAVVGLAVNGVPIFGNFAAPGDDIYQEAGTFDRCGGHPQMTGAYHYHAEPYAISYDDDAFVGLMRDGYPIYGRKDPDGSYPTIDADGGHTGVTIDSPSTAVYHYHVNEQTSTNAQSVGQKEWFLTTGTYHGAPAASATCN